MFRRNQKSLNLKVRKVLCFSDYRPGAAYSTYIHTYIHTYVECVGVARFINGPNLSTHSKNTFSPEPRAGTRRTRSIVGDSNLLSPQTRINLPLPLGPLSVSVLKAWRGRWSPLAVTRVRRCSRPCASHLPKNTELQASSNTPRWRMEGGGERENEN